MGTMKTMAGVFGLSGVALGAFGAHALKGQLTVKGTTEIWEKAVQYHLLHAVALLALAAFYAAKSPEVAKRGRVIGWSWTLGVVLFSGSLYALALGGPRWLGPITPVGGAAFLVGWFCLLLPSGQLRAGDGSR